MGDSSHADHVHVTPPLPPTTKKSNKIRDIVRLQQMLKKWKKAATTKNSNTSSNNNSNSNSNNNNNKNDEHVSPPKTTATKGLNKFLKKTLSFSDISNNSPGGQDEVVKKGYLAVWVGKDDEDGMKKFVIPTDYLAHQAFSVLLRDAEEEFGFQQEGILKIPCDVPLFEKILRMMSDNSKKQHQRPILRSSSSTSSFFLYEQDQQPPPPELLNHCSSPAPPHHHRHGSATTFDSKLKTPPTTPTNHLPLYCR